MCDRRRSKTPREIVFYAENSRELSVAGSRCALGTLRRVYRVGKRMGKVIGGTIASRCHGLPLIIASRSATYSVL